MLNYKLEMKSRILAILVLLFLVQGALLAQNKKMDSLKVELKNAKQDTTRLRVYKALCNECDVKDNLIYAEPAIDLVNKIIAETKEEKKRKDLLKEKMSFEYFFYVYYKNKNDTGKVSEYYQNIFSIYIEMKDTDNLVHTIRLVSQEYFSEGDFQKALRYSEQALSISKQMQYKKGIAGSYSQMGDMYNDQGEIAQSLENYNNALSILYTINDTDYLAYVHSLMGKVYGKQNNVSKSIASFNKAILLLQPKKWQTKLCKVYLHIGEMYKDNNDYTKSIFYYQKALMTAEELKEKSLVSEFLDKIGSVYTQQGDITTALEYHFKALKIAKELKDENAIAWSNLYISQTYNKQKNYKKAKEYNDFALNSKEFFDFATLRDAELLASQLDSVAGNSIGSLTHYKHYILFRDKLKSDEIHKLATKEKIQTEYKKQKEIDKREQDNKDALAKAALNQQTFQRNAFIGGFVLMVLLAGVSYRNFRSKNKDNLIITNQKHLVEEKNREITQSIQYALRIQTAILPPARIVKQYLENSFILYKPKDIVAGDFYWMEQVQLVDDSITLLANETSRNSKSSSHQLINTSANQLILFAACDCTGHGVPGAMVSVVCHNALNRAVREFGLTKPSEILDKTAEIVIENFSKSEESIKDGMDISLASLNLQTMELQWAGANNPLWIVRAGHPDLVEGVREDKMLRQAQHDSPQNFNLSETRADKQPIGMNEDSKPFTNHTFTLNSGDTIYLFTDGFADQFGGETGQKKLTRKRFKNLILSIQDKPMQEQGIALDKFITEYRKEVEQIDDILVMGVRV